MTRDEILALEVGPELNALVAKEIMGWVDNGSGYWRLPRDVGPGQSLLGTTWATEGIDSFAPSEDIAPAWEAIEQLMDNWLPSIFHDGQLWVCELNDLQRKAVASAIIAPHAISVAVLLAIMEEE